MIEPIFITGAGIISPIGVGKEETLASLLSCKTGIGQMRHLTSCHTDLPVGEVKLSNDEMSHLLGISNEPHISRTVLLGRIALREALEQAGIYGHDLRKVPLISSTTVAGRTPSTTAFTAFSWAAARISATWKSITAPAAAQASAS